MLAVLLLAVLSGAPAPGAGPALEASPLSVPGPGPWTAPVPSPDGRWLAFTTADHRGLYLMDLADGSVRRLNDHPGAGTRFAWAPDSSGVACRIRVGPFRLAVAFFRLDGTEEAASPLLPSVSTPFFQGDDLVFFRFDGDRPVEMRLGPGVRGGVEPPPATSPDGRLWLGDGAGSLRRRPDDGRVYYHPVPSPDGGRFVVECLDGHLYLGDAGGGEWRDLGEGSYPSFVREGRALLFERTRDDGHRLTAGDLFILDLETGVLTNLTGTPDRIERRPAASADGSRIYFEEKGRLYEGRLR